QCGRLSLFDHDHLALAAGAMAGDGPCAERSPLVLRKRQGRAICWSDHAGGLSMHRLARLAIFATAALALAACGNRSEVGNVGVDWTGNDISIEAVADPDVKGVVCHLAFFNRSFLD